MRELTTANVAFGFHRVRPEDAETLATQLRTASGMTSVATPYDLPGAIDATPDALALERATQLAPSSVRVLGETVVGNDGRSRTRVWVADPSDEIDRAEIVGATVETGAHGQLVIVVHLSDEGARAFGEVTAREFRKPLLIVLDDVVLSAPLVVERYVTHSVSIVLGPRPVGESQEAAVYALAAKIRFGALPSTPTITKLAARCAP